MRTRLLGFVAAVILAAFGAVAPAAQAAVPRVDGQKCMDGGGTVAYDSATSLWTCVGGKYKGESVP